MAKETSLSKLQKRADQLEKHNIKLRDLLAQRKDKQKAAEDSLKYYKKRTEQEFHSAVKKATVEMTKTIDELKIENENLKKSMPKTSK